jgi:hypothetical protein
MRKSNYPNEGMQITGDEDIGLLISAKVSAFVLLAGGLSRRESAANSASTMTVQVLGTGEYCGSDQ